MKQKERLNLRYKHWLFAATNFSDSSMNLSIARNALTEAAPVTDSEKWEKMGDFEIMSSRFICREDAM